MTENKRFTIEPISIRECIVDNTNGEQLDTFDYTERLCELLNELAEENDVLKQQLKTKHIVNKQYEELQRLKEENKELKQQREELFIRERDTKNEWRELREENKKLKEELLEAIDDLSDNRPNKKGFAGNGRFA